MSLSYLRRSVGPAVTRSKQILRGGVFPPEYRTVVYPNQPEPHEPLHIDADLYWRDAVNPEPLIDLDRFYSPSVAASMTAKVLGGFFLAYQAGKFFVTPSEDGKHESIARKKWDEQKSKPAHH
eukprot:TRINITY_DN2862_c0_g1_i1.p1 TRINITY_DN2862_c0_g1~~TRINITY_DN2862_c0_g1_i1.p1  ORF type:complete len:140 (-),score=59.02 TRINITY_DN2862_c0_g1_i1:182-550(-)